MEKSIPELYDQALVDNLLVPHQAPDVLVMRGTDRIDLLHRLGTNDVAGLTEGSVTRTLLLSAQGRLIDWPWVLIMDSELWIITQPGFGKQVHAWLQQYIFFQDDVTLKSLDEDWQFFGVYGPKALLRVGSLLNTKPEIDAEKWMKVQNGFVWQVLEPANGGVLMLVRKGADLDTTLQSEVMDIGVSEARTLYEILRIESGSPGPGTEVMEDTIPLEIGLRDWINFSKGCYIGQEIIARMDSRGQRARQLIGIRISGEASLQSELTQNGRIVGWLTSVAESPRFGWIGLALVTTRDFDPNTPIHFAEQDLAGKAIELPFHAPEIARSDG